MTGVSILLVSKAFMHGAGLSHATRGGGPCLRDAPWWKNINGVWFTTPSVVIFLTFRNNLPRAKFFNDARRK